MKVHHNKKKFRGIDYEDGASPVSSLQTQFTLEPETKADEEFLAFLSNSTTSFLLIPNRKLSQRKKAVRCSVNSGQLFLPSKEVLPYLISILPWNIQRAK